MNTEQNIQNTAEEGNRGKNVLADGEAKRMLAEAGFSIGQKVEVFDGQTWEKSGDIGDNECFWIEAKIIGCSVNEYKELLIEVVIADGRIALGYYKEGVRHCR